PVIIAKGKIRPVHRILLCDSGAESVSLLDRFTARLANLARDPEITVLHVMSQMSAGPGVRGQQLRASAEELIREHTPEGELLERDVQILERLNLHPDTKVRHGFVVNEICQEARSGDYDLIVIGAHQGKGWQRFLLEDLAYQIIMHAARPVLVLR
ncbi:MAG TPA: universal stress protein, partial [Anaerolineae bacterium]